MRKLKPCSFQKSSVINGHKATHKIPIIRFDKTTTKNQQIIANFIILSVFRCRNSFMSPLKSVIIIIIIIITVIITFYTRLYTIISNKNNESLVSLKYTYKMNCVAVKKTLPLSYAVAAVAACIHWIQSIAEIVPVNFSMCCVWTA